MRTKWQFILIVLIGLLSTLSGILGNLVSSELPEEVKPYLPWAWSLLGLVTLFVIGLAIWQNHLQAAITTDSLRTQHNYNRKRLLEKVRMFWIRGVLDQSLHRAALIALGLREQQDAVVISSPWRLVLQQSGQPSLQLSPGTHIAQVYDDAGGELLILGEPGCGKTTLLLELARDLLDRAQQDDAYPIPVIFNLSSWAVKQRPISDWLFEELHFKYQVPSWLSELWVNSDEMILLLDGLDEVTPNCREKCVKAINAYRQEHGLVPIIVCSRSTEYLTQATRIQLRRAVVVQPLTEQQIDDYLSSVGGQLSAVQTALRNDPDLRELIATPLMLSVFTLAYHGKSIEELKNTDSSTQRRQVFATYVQRMLQHRGIETFYTSQQIMGWLTWLAQQMAQHSQTEFYLEQIQPSWLPDSWSHRLYDTIVVKFFPVLIYGLISWLIYEGLSLLILAFFQSLATPYSMFLVVLCSTLGVILFVKRFGRRIDEIGKEIKTVETITWSWVSMQRSFVEFSTIGLAVGFVIGLIVVLLAGLFGGSFAILVGSVFREQIFSLLLWLSIGLAVALLLGLIMAIVFGLFGGLMGGMSSEMLGRHNLVKPNQGIWRSARNSVLFGLTVELVVGLIVGAVIAPLGGLTFGLISGLIVGLISGLIVGLFNGGVACIGHIVLRLLLWRAGWIPWNYLHFLDYATERILLRKVGGGYIFVHRSLLNYFASLDTKPHLDDSTKPATHSLPAS